MPPPTLLLRKGYLAFVAFIPCPYITSVVRSGVQEHDITLKEGFFAGRTSKGAIAEVPTDVAFEATRTVGSERAWGIGASL